MLVSPLYGVKKNALKLGAGFHCVKQTDYIKPRVRRSE